MEEKWEKNRYNKREEMIMIHDLQIIFKILSINARYCFFDSSNRKIKKKNKIISIDPSLIVKSKNQNCCVKAIVYKLQFDIIQYISNKTF